jgi:hypothetical protein
MDTLPCPAEALRRSEAFAEDLLPPMPEPTPPREPGWDWLLALAPLAVALLALGIALLPPLA